jgi:hypothetical protein
MKPIPRTQHLLEYTQGKYSQYFQETIGNVVNYPMFGYPEFLLYDNRLKEYGFTDFAINEAKGILGLESFGDLSMYETIKTQRLQQNPRNQNRTQHRLLKTQYHLPRNYRRILPR